MFQRGHTGRCPSRIWGALLVDLKGRTIRSGLSGEAVVKSGDRESQGGPEISDTFLVVLLITHDIIYVSCTC